MDLNAILNSLKSTLTGLSGSLSSGSVPQSALSGISKTLGGIGGTLSGLSSALPVAQTPSSSATTLQTPQKQAPSSSTPPVTLDSLTKSAAAPASPAPSAPSASPAGYIPYSNAATSTPPTGYTQVTPNQLAALGIASGGTYYTDASGNLYTPGSGGLSLVTDTSKLAQALPQYQDSNGTIYSSNGGPKNPGDTPLNSAAFAAIGKTVPSQLAPATGNQVPVSTPSTGTGTGTDTGTTPGSTTPPSSAANLGSYGLPTSNLQPGSKGADVSTLQQWLIQQGYSLPNGVTGTYDASTQAAVAQLQQSIGMNLPASYQGYYGPQTQAALSAAIAQQTPSSNTIAGSTQTMSNPLSQALAALGLPAGATDLLTLMFGPGSALEAEKNYLDQATQTATQQAKGDLAVRGILGSGFGDKQFADTMAQLGASNASQIAQLESPYIQSIFSLLTAKPTVIPQGAIAINPLTGEVINSGQPRITALPFGSTAAYSGSGPVGTISPSNAGVGGTLAPGGTTPSTVSGGKTGSNSGSTPATASTGSPTYTNAVAATYGLSDQQASKLKTVGVPEAVWGNIAAIIQGTQPPPGASGFSANAPMAVAVRNGLQALGFNLSQAASEWNATQKYITSANSSTQLRLRQAINSVTGALTNLDTLNSQWQRGGLTPLNSATLTAAVGGAFGPQAQNIATQFQQQLAIIQDELGQTFMGGNSPTDSALSLAAKALSGSWSQSQLSTAIDNLKANLTFRQNAIDSTGAAGVNGANPYLPNQNPPAATPGTASFYLNQPKGYIFNDGTMQYTANGDGTATGSDGNIYIDDGSGNITPQ